jgi:hypothetical protein
MVCCEAVVCLLQLLSTPCEDHEGTSAVLLLPPCGMATVAMLQLLAAAKQGGYLTNNCHETYVLQPVRSL